MQLDFHFDVVCPYAYLAHAGVPELEARTGASVRWCPVLLGGVFKAIGAANDPNRGFSSVRAAYQETDLGRWARLRGVPLVRPEQHPRRTVLAMRALHASPDTPRAARALFRAYWGEGRDLEDPGVVRAALDREGLDGAALVARASDPDVKAALRRATDDAVRAGVFGVPAFVVEGELLWGQDRMELVERALGHTPPTVAPRARAAAPRVEVFFDYSSPFAYLGVERLLPILERTGAEARWIPFLLGGLFRDLGQVDVPLFEMPEAKRRHALRDLERWAALGGVPFRFPERFPMNTVKALRMTLAAPERHRLALVRALFRAYWGGAGVDLANDGVLSAIATSAGLDGPLLSARTKEPELRDALRQNTDEARRRGAFGAPSYFVSTASSAPELYWGQDRLGLVERALSGSR